MNIEDNKKQFIEICKREIHRDGIDDLLSYLEKSDFFTAPASTKFHGSYPGGLCEHSLNVYYELEKLAKLYKMSGITLESVAIVSLFHDLCKVNFYKAEQRNRKNEEGKWESYTGYGVSEKFCFGSHGGKSVFIIQNYMKLTAEEGTAINCHMGAYGENAQSVSSAYQQYTLAWLCHVADEAATFILEKE